MSKELESVESWKNKFLNLAAINYNLYLAGTVRRADTGEDWTNEQAEEEIKSFIQTLLTKERQKAEEEKRELVAGIVRFIDDCELGTTGPKSYQTGMVSKKHLIKKVQTIAQAHEIIINNKVL